MVPSRKTAPDPMMVATRVQRCREVIRESLAEAPLRHRGRPSRQVVADARQVVADARPVIADVIASWLAFHRLTSMPGPVALVGAGEFLPAMADFDAALLA